MPKHGSRQFIATTLACLPLLAACASGKNLGAVVQTRCPVIPLPPPMLQAPPPADGALSSQEGNATGGSSASDSNPGAGGGAEQN